MKIKLYISAVICFVFIFTTGCSTVKNEKNGNIKKIKTALYIGYGSLGGGVINSARILKYSPQVELTLIDDKDLKKTKLKDFDIFVMPGGFSSGHMKSLGAEGVEILRNFIKNGGSYFGICAGCHMTLNRPNRLGLFPYGYLNKHVGGTGDVYIDLPEKGAELLGIEKGRYCVRYVTGPIMKKNAENWPHGKCEVIADYKSSISPKGRAGENFFGTPAILYGNYGKGKVIATSFHPESRIDSHKIFCGCFYAVTGVKLTPQFPRRQFHPLRVGYHFVNAQYKDQRAVINEVMELESHPELAVELGLDAEILNRVDVVVLGDARGLSWKDFIDAKRYDILIDFIHRGGKVIGVGEIWKKIPPHKNVIYVNPGKDVIKSVMNFVK